MELTKIFSRLAERTDTWVDLGYGSFLYKKPIRIRTIDDISLIGRQLARYAGSAPHLEYLYEGELKTPEEIGKLPNNPQASLDISAYTKNPNVASNGFGPMDYIVRCTFGSYEAKGRIGPACSARIHVRAEQRPASGDLTVEAVKNIVESSTEIVGPSERQRPYSVVKRISQATEEQRRHDRKIRWEAARISFGVSLGVAVLSAVLTLLLTFGT
ncbi:hypothetical protein [Arthrobacter sp. PsM3]|uniref:hypothetical protein n=1 Tax=Arthrobacter sp. PsM3 TaxID=3030531 RepID=UPI00263BB244|nr:hypothetical protein [Arthrobacter sp. PsM3]MDN4645487.1 hypothetical protein [Arthrobacter sp. PsM3]